MNSEHVCESNLGIDTSPKYSLVIPIFECQNSIHLLKEAIMGQMSKLKANYEIILVDDCSKDESWKKLCEISSMHAEIRILRLANNVGQWMTTLCGMSYSRGEYIITMDDDMEFDTGDLQRLITHIETNDYDIVYGIAEGKATKDLSNRMFYHLRNWGLNILLGKSVTESYKIVKRNVLFNNDQLIFPSLHFEAYAKFAVSQHRVGYVGVNYQQGVFSKSRHGFWKKIGLLRRFGSEYLSDPFKLIKTLSLLVIFVTMVVLVFETAFGIILESNILSHLPELLMAIMLFVVAWIGTLVYRIFSRLKGFPNYVVIEER
jgi:glycosyltransferase involved in cell wall biosynthesis